VPNQPIIAAPMALVDVVVAGRDVGGERGPSVFRTAPRAPLELLVHVLLDEIASGRGRAFVL